MELKFENRLNSQSWDAALADLALDRHDWQELVTNAQVTIDMSRVGFADFVTLGRLIIFISGLMEAGATVTLQMPTGEPLDGENSLERISARLQRQRQNWRLFIKQSGFESALTAFPQSKMSIREGNLPLGVGADRPAGSADQIEEPKAPHRLRKILPYRWIPPVFPGHPAWQASIASLEAALSGLGMSSEDSAAIAKALLAELIENVSEHAQGPMAGRSLALVGAAVMEPRQYGPRVVDFNPDLAEFVGCARDTDSPLIRLVVADSGRGLVASLSEKLEDLEARPPVPYATATTRQQGTILRAFQRGTSSARPGADPHPSIRGLWKVDRIVRSYQGSIAISTDGHWAGWAFSGPRAAEPMAGTLTAWVPGTFVECNLLARPVADALQTSEEVLTPKQRSGGDALNLACETVILRSDLPLGETELQRIRRAMVDQPRQGTSGLVVAVDTPVGGIGPGDGEIRKAVHDLLALVADVGTQIPIALVFPGANRRLLSLAIEDLNAERDAGTPYGVPTSRNPVLVVAPENRHYWVGGPRTARDLLRRLSSRAATGTVRHLSGQANDWIDVASAIRYIRDHSRLVERRGDEIRLRLRPHDAVGAVAGHLSTRVAQAIDTAEEPAVRRGHYLTPSLRLASRWCDMPRLLENMDSERLAGFVLANQVQQRLQGYDEQAPPTILSVGRPSPELVATLARSLSRTDEYFDSVASIGVERTGAADPSRQLLLVTDLISTASTLANAVTRAVARDLAVIGVVTVVDARGPTQSTLEREEVVLNGLRLPLISLVAVDFHPPEPSPQQPIPIDPVLGRPETEPRPKPPVPLIQQSEYTKKLIETRGSRLGHIQRPTGRHYSAYVDPTLLFHQEAWVSQVMQRVQTKIQIVRKEAFGDEHAAACIVYPEQTAGDVARVARQVGDVLNGMKIDFETVTVPRAPFGTHWLFPASVPIPPATRHIILIDSGIRSGHTFHQLIRVCAAPSVEVVTAFFLTNGLTDLDAIAVQQIKTVRRPRVSGAQLGLANQDHVDVRVYFMARTAATGLDARDCPICALIRDYESISAHTPVPARIEQQRTWLIRSLQPRSKRQVFQEEATDLLGTHISQEDCITYLQWRYDVREATTSTLRRLQLDADIDKAAGNPRLRDALVRLLTAETLWLSFAPLRFPQVRGKIARLAESLLLGESAGTSDPVLQVQALMLLSRVDKAHFVERLRDIATASSDQPLVWGQVLLETLRLLSGRGPSSKVAHDPLIQSLTHKLMAIEGDLRERPPRGGPDPEPAGVQEVRYLISHGRRTLQPAPVDPQGAWEALRRYRISVIGLHSPDNAMWRLLNTLGNIGRGLRPTRPDDVRDDWMQCSEFLIFNVLPNVELLREHLLGRSTLIHLSPDDGSRWDSVVNGDGRRQLDNILIRLDDLLTRVEASEASIRYSLDELVGELNWWNRFFLATHVGGRGNAGAFLTEVVNKCPTPLVEVVEAEFSQTERTIVVEPGLTDVDVFCTVALLRDVFTHIKRNAQDTHCIPDRVPRFQIDISASGHQHIDVTVWNTDSEPRPGGRNGLSSLHTELQPFDGALRDPAGPCVPPFTYGKTIRLVRWRIV
jgi:hypothetical protein